MSPSLVRRTFSDEPGPGTFHSLGLLPKRTHHRRSPVFHIHHGDDDEHSLDEHSPPSPPSTIEFPRTESSLPQCESPSSSPSSTPRSVSPCSQLARGLSAPIFLANGKPLKPSLKLSSSSPAMLMPTHMPPRSRSVPSTPKNVHFPEKDFGLATVCVYSCTARPDALSSPVNGNDDDTETEGEDSAPTRFPFSSSPSVCNYEIDPVRTSAVPSKNSPPTNLILESLNLSPFSASSSRKPFLTGSVLVRNLAFEKHVAVRFTLDEWQTVSEVGAHYADSISDLPSQIVPSPPPANIRGRGWDRFKFMIRLEDYSTSLSTRTLWLAARYRTNSTYPEPGSSMYGPGGEWWDNNGGTNYCVGFKPVTTTTACIRSKPRRETFSGPISSYRLPQPPSTFKDHALGFMVPSVSGKGHIHSTPMRTGKLNLCNYVPPTVRATSFLPSAVTTNAAVTPSPTQLPSEKECASPASSTLSTPPASPTFAPRVIINGQPATSARGPSEKEIEENATCSKPGYITELDWSAPDKPQAQAVGPPPRPHDGHVPGSGPPERPRNGASPQNRNVLASGNSLYDAFVMQWCFAQPSSYHGYDGGGIMT